MNKLKIDVLGTEYEIFTVNPYEKIHGQQSLDEQGLGGYCDDDLKEIYIADMKQAKGWENERNIKISERHKSVLRHEIVHAFLNESGLSWDSYVYSNGWAKNEEMIDWFAAQGKKIYEAWKSANAI